MSEKEHRPGERGELSIKIKYIAARRNYPIKSIKDLIDTYNAYTGDKEIMLADLSISGGAKPRKLGKALSKKIYEYFCL